MLVAPILHLKESAPTESMIRGQHPLVDGLLRIEAQEPFL